MHLAPSVMGSETANVLPSSTAADVRHAIPSFMLQPVWKNEHLKVLRVKEKIEVPVAAVVGKFNLPKDGRDDFEELATEIEKPTREELLNFAEAKDTFRLNVFWPLFSDLYEISGLEHERTSQNKYVRSAKSAMRCLTETIMPYVDDEGSLRIDLNSIPFHLRRIAVKGVLACDGCVIKTDMQGHGASPLPVAAFSVVRPKDSEDVEAQEASQLVLQAALAYEQNPTLKSYKAFAVHINKTELQVVSADIPRVYIERLYQGMACPEGFEVLHSAPCDMLDVQGRREALRATMGLLKAVRSKAVQRPMW